MTVMTTPSKYLEEMTAAPEPTVADKMGNVQLQFVWMSPDRQRYRYANALASVPCQPKWKKFHKQMKSDNHFVVLTYTKEAPGSRSGYSYEILGVLFTLYTDEDLQLVSHAYWNATKGINSPYAKLEAGFRVATMLANVIVDDSDQGVINYNTFALYEECKNGGLKAAKKLAKELFSCLTI